MGVEDVPSTSTAAPPYVKAHHRRTSSLWVPPTRPTFANPGEVLRKKAENGSRAIKQLVPAFARKFFERNEDKVKRVIVPNNQSEPPPRYEHPNRHYSNNRISTTKYSIISFIPKNLFEQFHRSANLYFIFIVVLNMIIGAFGRYISMLPIAFVLCVTAIKDAFEDYRRYKSDRKINHMKCRVWDSSQGRYRKMEWRHIVVGDFVHLGHDEVIPADILLLRSSDACGICYVETSNLDGESNLKQRMVAKAMGGFHGDGAPVFSPDKFTYTVTVEPPCTDVYKFEGRLEPDRQGVALAKEHTVLVKENLLLRGCVIKNTDFVEGIVLYAGHETKAMLNNSGPRYKRSELEKLTNWDIIWCVLILLVLCLAGAVLSGVWLASFENPQLVPFLAYQPTTTNPDFVPSSIAFVNFWSFIIVLQVMIPISLYVSIEIIKLGQIYFLSQDSHLYNEKLDKRIQCRALNIPEELGQIEYVMSDKTGTLTENEMVFRRCSVVGKSYSGQDAVLEGLLRSTVSSSNLHSPLFAFFLSLALCNTVVVNSKPHEDMMDPFGDVIEEEVEEEHLTPKVIFEDEKAEISDGIELMIMKEEKEDKEESKEKEEEKEKEEKDEKKEETKKDKKASVPSRPSLMSFARLKGLKDLTPFRRSLNKRASTATLPDIPPPQSFYDSESPDELALVEAAKDYGLRLMRRSFDEVTVHAKAISKYIKYKVLYTLPFDADRKMMSVMIRDAQGEIILLCKGADSSILPLLSPEFSESTSGEQVIHASHGHLSDYARDGLRTLCVARRVISETEYSEWRNMHEEAQADPHHRENLLRESFARVERDLELLGVTAIEDRLQDGVPECIEALRDAGTHVWVLTGDKAETAVNIAYSSRLFSQRMDLLNVSSTGVGVVSDLLDLHLSRVQNVDGLTTLGRFGLVLNAEALEYCLEPYNIERFCRLIRRCESVLCCRATPLQKASLVRLAKTRLKGKVLAIGDGANDVSMIQGADVGVGLSGQEGMQAVMASDFALARFRYLGRLLLVHGHWCYHRLAVIILYFFYKNAMFVFCIFWYQIYNGFSSQVPIDPIYLMVYNFLFTSLPSLLYGFMEQDASAELLTKYAYFYDHGRLAKKYRWFSFWLNMLDAVWQSAVVYFLAHFTVIESECDMWYFGMLLCSQLLIVNSLHLGFLVQFWTVPLVLALVVSVASFFGFALIYNLLVAPSWGVKDTPSLVAEVALIDPRFWLVLVLSAVLALLPRFTFVVIRNSLFPPRMLIAKLHEQESSSLLNMIRVEWTKRNEKNVHISSRVPE